MTGSPIDGIPWWGKLIIYPVIFTVGAASAIKETAKKVFTKKEKKGKK